MALAELSVEIAVAFVTMADSASPTRVVMADTSEAMALSAVTRALASEMMAASAAAIRLSFRKEKDNQLISASSPELMLP